MHHQVDAFRGKDPVKGGGVGEVRFLEFHARRNRGAVPVDKIVEHHGLMARSDELANAMTADITGSPGNEYFHTLDLYCF